MLYMLIVLDLDFRFYKYKFNIARSNKIEVITYKMNFRTKNTYWKDLGIGFIFG